MRGKRRPGREHVNVVTCFCLLFFFLFFLTLQTKRNTIRPRRSALVVPDALKCFAPIPRETSRCWNEAEERTNLLFKSNFLFAAKHVGELLSILDVIVLRGLLPCITNRKF